jgi:hypothetical protein
MGTLKAKVCASALVAATIAGFGCTGSDALSPGVVGVPIVTTATGDTDFECVRLTFARVTLQPLDPSVQALLDGGQVDLLIDGEAVDFATDEPCTLGGGGDFPTATLPTGEYRLSMFSVGRPVLFDAQTSTPLECSGTFDLSSFYNLTFRVDADTRIRFELDSEALLAIMSPPNFCLGLVEALPSILTVEID